MANKFPNGLQVSELTSKDYKISGSQVTITNKLFKNKNGLIMVYAPWCPHCVSMVEPLLHLANELKNYLFKIGAINSENELNKEVVASLGVNGFPTLYYVNTKGKMKEIRSNGRSNDALLKAVCDMTNVDNEETNTFCCEKTNNKYICKKNKK